MKEIEEKQTKEFQGKKRTETNVENESSIKEDVNLNHVKQNIPTSISIQNELADSTTTESDNENLNDMFADEPKFTGMIEHNKLSSRENEANEELLSNKGEDESKIIPKLAGIPKNENNNNKISLNLIAKKTNDKLLNNESEDESVKKPRALKILKDPKKFSQIVLNVQNKIDNNFNDEDIHLDSTDEEVFDANYVGRRKRKRLQKTKNCNTKTKRYGI